MYGLIGKIAALSGEREERAAILLEGPREMPGNLSYVVAKDPGVPDVLWVTDVWTDKGAHEASLSLASVQDAIQKGRPLIAGLERIAETDPVGGHGL